MTTAEFWRGYSRKTGTLTWRLAQPSDLPAIRKLRNIAERFLGCPQKNPRLFDMPVLLTLVAENEKGQIVDALYVEAQVELVKIACRARGFEESAGLEEDLSHWLRSIGIRTVLATTPPKLKDRMRGVFEALGFRLQDGWLSYWKRRL